MKTVTVYFEAPESQDIEIEGVAEELWDKYVEAHEAARSPKTYDRELFRKADELLDEFTDEVYFEIDHPDLVETIEPY